MKIDVKYSWSRDDLTMFKQIKEPVETYVIDTDYINDERDFVYAIVDEIYQRHGIVCHNDTHVKKHVVDYNKTIKKIIR